MKHPMIKVYTLDNARLDFKNSRESVIKFIEHRCRHFGYDFMGVVQNEIDLETKVGRGTEVVLVDIMAPIFDPDYIEWTAVRFPDLKLKSFGQVPGTAPVLIWGKNAKLQADVKQIRWETQSIFNNQFNLYKFKRLKIFLELTNRIKNMHTMNLETFCEVLSKDDQVFELIASYAVGGNLIYYKTCPHCGSDSLPVPATSCQPMIGFLPSNRPIYHECQSCKLCYLSPRLPDEKLSHLYDEYDYEDFKQSLNNPYLKNSPRADLELVQSHFNKGISTIDLGGGVGKYSELLKSRYPNWSVTHSDFSLKTNTEHLNSLNIKTRSLNFLEEPIGNQEFNLVTMWEVIEHIPYEKLVSLFKNIRTSLVDDGFFVFSTPDFSSHFCFIGDFFNVAAPFHLTCFTRNWLENFVKNLGGWKVESIRANCDLLDDWTGWLGYLESSSPGPGNRATFEVLKPHDNLRQSTIKHSLETAGSEFIMTLRKV